MCWASAGQVPRPARPSPAAWRHGGMDTWPPGRLEARPRCTGSTVSVQFLVAAGAECFTKCSPAPPTRPPPPRCPHPSPQPPTGSSSRPGPCHARPEEAQAASLGAGCGRWLFALRTHRALRVAISRDPLDRLGSRLASGRSELDTEHLHAAWRAWDGAVSSKERSRLRQGRQPHDSARHASCVAALPSDRALPDPDLSGRGLVSAESGVAPGRVSCGGGVERRATTSPPHAHAAHHVACERYRSGWLGRRGCTSRAGLARRRGSSSA